MKLSDALAYTYQHNPTLRAARAQMKAVQEEMPQAQAGWKPTVDAAGNVSSVKIDGSNFGGEGTTSKEFDVRFAQPLYRGGRTIASTAVAHDTIMAQRALLNALEQDIMLKAATAYMDVVREQAMLDLAVNNETVIGKQLEATRKRFDVGELTRTDVSQAEARLARARADKSRAAALLQASLAVYGQVVGKPAGMLEYPAITFPVPQEREEAATLAERNNPNVIAAEFIHESSAEDVGQIFGELLPELSFFGSWNRQYDPQPGLLKESTTGTLGLSASIPLYEAGATRSRVRQAKHTANQRFLQIMEMRRAVRAKAVGDWENLKAARAGIDSRKAQVEASEVARKGVEGEADLGSRTVLDTLDAEQELLDARAALVAARRDEVVASFALASTLGLLTPKVLGFNDYSAELDEHLDSIQWKILGMDVDIDEGKP